MGQESQGSIAVVIASDRSEDQQLVIDNLLYVHTVQTCHRNLARL
jgi:hypothetical protein